MVVIIIKLIEILIRITMIINYKFSNSGGEVRQSQGRPTIKTDFKKGSWTRRNYTMRPVLGLVTRSIWLILCRLGHADLGTVFNHSDSVQAETRTGSNQRHNCCGQTADFREVLKIKIPAGRHRVTEVLEILGELIAGREGWSPAGRQP
jgi:hypothetical protein